MNRTVALQRRTPLRAKTGMPRSTKPLPARSEKRKALQSARDACRREVLLRDPVCRRCGAAPSTEVHELHRGQLRAVTFTDADLCRGLCRTCHDWVTEHPAEAHAEGLSRWSWEYGR